LGSIDITDEKRYAREGFPWAEWDLLRREAPVYWYQPPRPDLRPFWAITRHEDIQLISRLPGIFVSSKRLRLHPADVDDAMAKWRAVAEAKMGKAWAAPLSFIDMDPPDHAKYRALVNRRFTPRAVRAMEGQFHAIAKRHVDAFIRRLHEAGDVGCDLVTDVAINVPSDTIFTMLGIPEEEWDQLFAWREHDIRQPDETVRRRQQAALHRFDERDSGNEYLLDLIAQRRAAGAPSETLIDVLIRAQVDEQPLPDRPVLSYVNLLIAGGLDTTRHSITGGVIALLEHPDELQKLVANRALMKSAVEEILRWVTPVVHFTRTAVSDFELRGQRIKAGEDVAMWYPAANRDESVFEDPYRFDIAREPNRHLAFGGFGEHFCLGANLARWQMYAMLGQLLPVLPRLEIVGDPIRTDGNLHVVGYKSLRLRLAR
jgi:cholest-4-en-3-one 26-monooxygenase